MGRGMGLWFPFSIVIASAFSGSLGAAVLSAVGSSTDEGSSFLDLERKPIFVYGVGGCSTSCATHAAT